MSRYILCFHACVKWQKCLCLFILSGVSVGEYATRCQSIRHRTNERVSAF